MARTVALAALPSSTPTSQSPLCYCREVIVSNPPGPFQPTWDSLENYQTPDWYQDAKLGIFIHWGAYSVPAHGSEWYPRHMYLESHETFAHHAQTYGPQSKFGYKDLIPLFKGEKFNADVWLDLFKESGAKYIVPVAEHHDGFAMYHTKLSKWNAVEMGPKRDVIQELAEAAERVGITFGLSSHRAEHWWFFNGGRAFESDVTDPEFADLYGPAAPETTQPDEAFLNDWLSRCAELVDRFNPRLVYFDWWIEQPAFAPYLRRFASYYYNRAYGHGTPAAINYKYESFPEKAAVYDIERGHLAGIRPRFWQTCTALGKNSWGHIEGMEYKAAHEIIEDLIDIVSKNGTMLLNVGPKADGTIPKEDEQLLRALGAWLKVNGEAIYGTRPWKVFGEGPTHIESGPFRDTERTAFTGEDIRFTTKPGSVYAIFLKNGVKGGKIRSMGKDLTLLDGEVKSMEIVGAQAEVKWKQNADGLSFELPSEFRAEGPIAIKVTI